MAHIVILGAGIGGLPMAYEMKQLARPEDRVTVVSNTSTFHFVPSNPWVGVNWRGRENIRIWRRKRSISSRSAPNAFIPKRARSN